MRSLQCLLIVCAIATAAAAFVDAPEERIVTRPLPPKPPELQAVTQTVIEIGAPVRVIQLDLPPALRVAAARLVMNEWSAPLRGRDDGGTAGELTADALGILQVVHDFAAWKKTTHAKAIRRLSPHVVAGKKATRRRHAVYRTLPAIGFARPPLWRDEIDGPWQAYGENWARARAAVDRACVTGFAAPCPVPVIAWGGEMDIPIAESRKLVRVVCAGQPINGFYALARATGSANQL